MTRVLLTTGLLWIASAAAALACTLDDCDLPVADHRPDPASRAAIPADNWGWMNHDLALARAWLADGDPERALALVRVLDRAIRVQLDDLVEHRGERGVNALHQAIREVAVSAGGQLEPLVIPDRASNGRRLRTARASSGVGLEKAEDRAERSRDHQRESRDALREERERRQRGPDPTREDGPRPGLPAGGPLPG